MMRPRDEIMGELNGSQPASTASDYGSIGQAKANHRAELNIELLLDMRDIFIVMRDHLEAIRASQE